jgi:hypothetical protein
MLPDQDLEVMRNAIDMQKKVQTVLKQTTELLQERDEPDAADLLRNATEQLAQARRALSLIADRSLSDTQPIAMPIEPEAATTPESELIAGLVARGWKYKVVVVPDGYGEDCGSRKIRQLQHSCQRRGR